MICPNQCAGEMAEWLKAHAWKACLGETLTWVRIPLSPPSFLHLAPDQVDTDQGTNPSRAFILTALTRMMPRDSHEAERLSRGGIDQLLTWLVVIVIQIFFRNII